MIRLFVLGLIAVLSAGCSSLGQLAWQAMDQAGSYNADPYLVREIETPAGFRIMRVVNGLNFPSAFTWDAEENLYILESYTVPVPMLEMKIVRVSKGGGITRVPLRGANAPGGETAIGLMFHDGWLYLSHEEKDGTFGISRVRPTGGLVEPVLRGIPVQADHDVNHLVFDSAGNLYFGVGSATNSGVISAGDPVNAKWLEKFPSARDIPCRDIRLTGATFTDKGVVTGAFQAHGRSGATTIRGESLCSSSIYRLRPGSKEPELIAWGFRNPVALAFDRDGTLLVGMHGADVRSARPVRDDPDSVLRVREGVWYGWPDFSAALEPLPIPPVIDLRASGLSAPDRSLLVAATEPHAALSGMALLPSNGFGPWGGHIVVAEMGDFRPLTDPNLNVRAGFQVEWIDPAAHSIQTFLRNRKDGEPAPSSSLDYRNGFERPVDVRIGPDGLLYVLDYGAFITSGGEPKAFPKTGKLFRLEPLRE